MTRDFYIINTTINPCSTGMFENKIAKIIPKGRNKFIQSIRNSGAPHFGLPFLSLYRKNRKEIDTFLGLHRSPVGNFKRWDLQYDLNTPEILIGGAVIDGMIGTSLISDYVKLLLKPNPLFSRSLTGIVQFLDDDSDIKEDLYPEEINKLNNIRNINLRRIYLKDLI